MQYNVSQFNRIFPLFVITFEDVQFKTSCRLAGFLGCANKVFGGFLRVLGFGWKKLQPKQRKGSAGRSERTLSKGPHRWQRSLWNCPHCRMRLGAPFWSFFFLEGKMIQKSTVPLLRDTILLWDLPKYVFGCLGTTRSSRKKRSVQHGMNELNLHCRSWFDAFLFQTHATSRWFCSGYHLLQLLISKQQQKQKNTHPTNMSKTLPKFTNQQQIQTAPKVHQREPQVAETT